MASSVSALTRATPAEARSLVPVFNEAARRLSTRGYLRSMVALRRRMERSEARKVQGWLRDLGKHVAAATEASGGLVVATEADVQASRSERARINAIVKAADLPAWQRDKVLPWLHSLYGSAWTGAYSLSQQNLTDTQIDAITKKILKAGGKRMGLIDITPSVKRSLFRVLEFAREWEAGKPSPTQVARWIRDEVPAGRFVNAGSKYRAELIARTEIMNATRLASIENFKADPDVEKLEAMDGDYDEECRNRNGKLFTFEQADQEAAGTHPNCTLAFGPAYVK